MTEPIIDYDRLDGYRLSIKYVASSFNVAKDLNGCHRHARDQWLRAAQSIPLNIAEANGKRSFKTVLGFSTLLAVRRWNARRFNGSRLEVQAHANRGDVDSDGNEV